MALFSEGQKEPPGPGLPLVPRAKAGEGAVDARSAARAGVVWWRGATQGPCHPAGAVCLHPGSPEPNRGQ